MTEILKNVPRRTFSNPSCSFGIFFSGRVYPDCIQEIIYLSTPRTGFGKLPRVLLPISTKEIDDRCTKSNGEHSAEPEIEEISPCLATSFVCIPETDYPSFSGMTEEDIQSGPNEETSEYHQDYIKHWFEVTIQSKYHSHLQLIFTSSLSKLLIVHAHVPSKVYMLNLGMIISFYLIRTWLHWKFSFT